ncbi:MAG TPA: hypothetical protein VJ608_12895 [Albitalea sp.]|nr:hypothetical protein [Albitalea sp.]
MASALRCGSSWATQPGSRTFCPTSSVATLTRTSFERLRRERPDVASAFYEFLLRTLSDRLRLTEKMVLAMRL